MAQDKQSCCQTVNNLATATFDHEHFITVAQNLNIVAIHGGQIIQQFQGGRLLWLHPIFAANGIFKKLCQFSNFWDLLSFW